MCLDYDEKAKRVYLFGPEYQFKDTPECRTLVNNYNCLAWGSKDNPCPDAPLPPCRSLCVEVADKCVFMHLYRYYLDNVCARINCEYLAEQNCVPGSFPPSFKLSPLIETHRRTRKRHCQRSMHFASL